MLRSLARLSALAAIAAAVFAVVHTARRFGIGTCVRCHATVVPWAYYCQRCGRHPASASVVARSEASRG